MFDRGRGRFTPPAPHNVPPGRIAAVIRSLTDDSEPGVVAEVSRFANTYLSEMLSWTFGNVTKRQIRLRRTAGIVVDALEDCYVSAPSVGAWLTLAVLECDHETGAPSHSGVMNLIDTAVTLPPGYGADHDFNEKALRATSKAPYKVMLERLRMLRMELLGEIPTGADGRPDQLHAPEIATVDAVEAVIWAAIRAWADLLGQRTANVHPDEETEARSDAAGHIAEVVVLSPGRKIASSPHLTTGPPLLTHRDALMGAGGVLAA